MKGDTTMDVRIDVSEPHTIQDEKLPLLPQKAPPPAQNPMQRAISLAFQSTASLANLLPTGTVLVFQLLAPVFSNQAACDDVDRAMTAALVALCAVSCVLLSFTDSFQDRDGNVYHGFVTTKGLWVIDGYAELPMHLNGQYRLKFIDFVHAFTSLLVFGAIALFDDNVVGCFYPDPSTEEKEVLNALPVGIGVICSTLFVVFPTTRHGIGFPVTSGAKKDVA